MLVKEESESDYKTLDFQGIADFVYEKGYEYALWVEKRTLVNPPADGSSIVYKLIDVISKAKVEYEYTIKVDGPNPFCLPKVVNMKYLLPVKRRNLQRVAWLKMDIFL